MRIPVPSRINPKIGTVFIVALFLVEILEGTDLIFAALVALWMALFFAAFTLCKGLTYPSGAWITFFGLVSAFIGLVGKALLLEPAETHLKEPIVTMSVYCVGMASACAGAYFGHRLAPKRALLEGFVVGETMHRAAIGCLITGFILSFGLFAPGTAENGSLLALIAQLNQFQRLALILATYYIVEKSDGRQLFDWVVLASGGLLFAQGLIGYSKEGMFFPLVAWLLTAIVAGARFSVRTLGFIAISAFIMVYYLVPFSQYGRRSRSDTLTFSQQADNVIGYLVDPEGTRKLYLSTEADNAEQNASLPHFFDSGEGLLDREQMLAFDDSLIAYTDDGNVYGLTPELISFLNLVPHFLWPNKPSFASGNFYGRELGVIDSEDDTTGISFSPVGDAYHQGKWLAVIFVLPAIVFLYGFATDSMVGNVKKSPWALLPVAVSSTVAPEGLLQGTIYMATYTMFSVLVIAVVARFVFPLAVSLVMGEIERRTQGPRLDFTPARRRTTLLEGPNSGTDGL